MKAIWLFCFGMACLQQAAQAEVIEVPGTGRWADVAFSTAEVNRATQVRYSDVLADYAAAKQLDADAALTRRVRKIGATLVAAAANLKPEVKKWNWEFHTASDPGAEAFCMAGGKLVIGSAFVDRLKLSDGELAMLLAHEIAHAVAEHHREELSEVLRIGGRKTTTPQVAMAQLDLDLSLQFRLATLSIQQETEADDLGMLLAHRAGWSTRDMLGFYTKLAATAPPQSLFTTYPSMASRLSMAKGMAKLFEGMDGDGARR